LPQGYVSQDDLRLLTPTSPLSVNLMSNGPLLAVKSFNTGMITSDSWGSYAREVPKEKHLTGKIFTQRIERNNLTFRTRIKQLARETICFSHHLAAIYHAF